MIKLYISMVMAFVFSSIVLFSTPALAQYTGPQSNNVVRTVAAAARASDNTQVILDGIIVHKVRHEHYLFKDSSGSIEVEIDDKYFPLTPVNEHILVRIYGEVDKDFGMKDKIDVKKVEVI